MAEKIDSITFEAPVVREYSSTAAVTKLGVHKSTMELFRVSSTKYVIEWDIPELEEFVEYGIWVEYEKGHPILCDYDGGFSLPAQAIELLRKNNIIVPEDFE